jgi:vacuolar-type H+-ATPase subunit I/STV1
MFLILTYAIVDLSYLQNQRTNHNALTQSITHLQQQLNDQKTQLQTLQQKPIAANQNTEPAENIEELKNKINHILSRARTQQELMSTVADLLQKNTNIKLLKAENLAPVAWSAEDAQLLKWNKGPLLEQGIVLEFESDFASTLNYAYKLEELVPECTFTALNYQVLRYPRAHVRIELHYF